MAKDLTLTELYDKYGVSVYPTDKAHVHFYLPFYDELFAPYRYKEINIFEIGYLDAGSVKLWEDYFPYAQIRAIDITDEYRQKNGVTPTSGRVRLDIFDATKLTPGYFIDFPPDIVIDDASHISTHQIHTIKTIYPVLRKGGMLIIEDFGSPEKLLKGFEDIGYPFEVVDLRHLNNRHDNMLLVYHK